MTRVELHYSFIHINELSLQNVEVCDACVLLMIMMMISSLFSSALHRAIDTVILLMGP